MLQQMWYEYITKYSYIESKLKLWKKQYNIVYNMLNKIAFEWIDPK